MSFLSKITAAQTKTCKKFSGSNKDFNYVYCVDGIEDEYWAKSFGQQLDDLKIIKKFKASAKKESVGTKGKATLTAVKNWIKEHNPKQYWANWQKDSTSYKDDVVDIWYI